MASAKFKKFDKVKVKDISDHTAKKYNGKKGVISSDGMRYSDGSYGYMVRLRGKDVEFKETELTTEEITEGSKDEKLYKALLKQRAVAVRKGQTTLVNSLHKQIEKLVKTMRKNKSITEAGLKLDYCGKCMQMTNHKDKKCQKCKKKNESVNENYNLGLGKEIEYEKAIGKVVSKLKGIDAYAKTTAGYGKTPVNSSANHIYVTQYGKVDNTSKLKSILKKADPNLDVSKLKNNFNASDSARSKHDQDNDIWKYSIPKKMDWHQAKKAGILKTKPIKKMSHDVVIDLLDMMAPYTSKQHELADQKWTSLDSFMQHASDLISGSNWKKFQQSVKKKYPVLESVSEATIMTRAQTIWKDLKKYPIQKPTSGMANKADFAALIHFSGQTWAKNVAGGKWIRTDIKNPNFPNKNPNIISSNDLDKKLRTQNKVQIKEGKLTKESVNEAKNKIKPGTEIRWPSNHKNKSLAGRSGYVAKIKGSNALMNMHDNSNNKAMWIPVPIKDLPEYKKSINGDFPKQYAKAYAKATGNESVNEAESSSQTIKYLHKLLRKKDADITIKKKAHGQIVYVNGETSFNLDDRGITDNDLRKKALQRAYASSKKNEVNEGTSWPKEVEAYAKATGNESVNESSPRSNTLSRALLVQIINEELDSLMNVTEDTVTFSKDEMEQLHSNGKVIKIDPETKEEHIYIFSEGTIIKEKINNMNEEQLDAKKVLTGIKKFQKMFGTKAPLDVRKYPKSIGTIATIALPSGSEKGSPEQAKKHKLMQKAIKSLKLPVSKLDSVKGQATFWVQYGVDESINEAASQFKHAVQTALKANGYNLKQSEVKIGAKKVRGMGTKITLNGEMIGFDDNIPKMIANFTKAIKDDPKKYKLKESIDLSESTNNLKEEIAKIIREELANIIVNEDIRIDTAKDIKPSIISFKDAHDINEDDSQLDQAFHDAKPVDEASPKMKVDKDASSVGDMISMLGAIGRRASGSNVKKELVKAIKVLQSLRSSIQVGR